MVAYIFQDFISSILSCPTFKCCGGEPKCNLRFVAVVANNVVSLG